MGERSERSAAELVGEVERGLEELETLPDPVARATATEVIQALLELYGTGLGRIVEAVAERDDGSLAQALARDDLVAHLLLIHGLHPVAVEDRVREALSSVRPYLESHGGDVELLAVQDAVVRLRLEGSCSGCPSSAMTLKLAIENAIHKAAPEIEEVVAVDGALAVEHAPSAPPLLQIELAPAVADRWAMAGAFPNLADGQCLVKPIAGQPILFLRLASRLYGYLPDCPSCAGKLTDGSLQGAELRCPECGAGYDPLRAGRGLDSPHLHLEPVPLLVGEDGLAKVAPPVVA